MKRELQKKICNRKPQRAFVDPFNSDKYSDCTDVSYLNDAPPADEGLEQFCDGLSSCFPLNNHFLRIQIIKK